MLLRLHSYAQNRVLLMSSSIYLPSDSPISPQTNHPLFCLCRTTAVCVTQAASSSVRHKRETCLLWGQHCGAFTRATVFLLGEAGWRVLGCGGGRVPCRGSVRTEKRRTNPVKLQMLSCSSTGHVWLQRMNFDGQRQSHKMIEVGLGGVCVCVCV